MTALLVLAGVPVRAAPSATDILRRALDLSAEVKDYTAKITVDADLEGAPEAVPPFKVFFKRPDKVHVESRSIVIVRKDMLTFGNLARRLEEGAQVDLLGTKSVGGVPIHSLKLTPKRQHEGRPPVRLLITVNGARWTVERMEIVEGEKRPAAISWSYALVSNRYWMPAQIRCDMPAMPKRDGTPGARLTVTLSDYQVNTGLSDALFEEPPSAPRPHHRRRPPGGRR